MAGIVKIFRWGAGNIALPFAKGKSANDYLSEAGVDPGKGVVCVDNIPVNGPNGDTPTIENGSRISVVPKGLKGNC